MQTRRQNLEGGPLMRDARPPDFPTLPWCIKRHHFPTPRQSFAFLLRIRTSDGLPEDFVHLSTAFHLGYDGMWDFLPLLILGYLLAFLLRRRTSPSLNPWILWEGRLPLYLLLVGYCVNCDNCTVDTRTSILADSPAFLLWRRTFFFQSLDTVECGTSSLFFKSKSAPRNMEMLLWGTQKALARSRKLSPVAMKGRSRLAWDPAPVLSSSWCRP